MPEFLLILGYFFSELDLEVGLSLCFVQTSPGETLDKVISTGFLRYVWVFVGRVVQILFKLNLV